VHRIKQNVDSRNVKSKFHCICVVRAPNIEVKVLEELYNSLVESHMMTGVEIWELEDGWKETGKSPRVIL
jgi:hypothetical protein